MPCVCKEQAPKFQRGWTTREAYTAYWMDAFQWWYVMFMKSGKHPLSLVLNLFHLTRLDHPKAGWVMQSRHMGTRSGGCWDHLATDTRERHRQRLAIGLGTDSVRVGQKSMAEKKALSSLVYYEQRRSSVSSRSRILERCMKLYEIVKCCSRKSQCPVVCWSAHLGHRFLAQRASDWACRVGTAFSTRDLRKNDAGWTGQWVFFFVCWQSEFVWWFGCLHGWWKKTCCKLACFMSRWTSIELACCTNLKIRIIGELHNSKTNLFIALTWPCTEVWIHVAWLRIHDQTALVQVRKQPLVYFIGAWR